MIVCLMENQAMTTLPQFQPDTNFNSAGETCMPPDSEI